MITCKQCSTENLDGSEYCDECGAKLKGMAAVRVVPAAPAVPPPPQFVSPPQFNSPSLAPKPATPFTPPAQAAPVAANITSVASHSTSNLVGNARATRVEAGSANGLLVHARLVIQRGGQIGKEFSLTENDSLIGRWDADGGIFPDIDLDQDDPEAKVSRRHARIHWQNNQYAIEDLGSTNGTFVNRGPRLLPGNKQALKNGDEIIVGKTFLKFVTQS
ncbi:MAG: FHA domain-containing protein [Acidobacteria bacterium]|nr:FHA domain-containing protein [Acidobacteriota bacterium]